MPVVEAVAFALCLAAVIGRRGEGPAVFREGAPVAVPALFFVLVVLVQVGFGFSINVYDSVVLLLQVLACLGIFFTILWYRPRDAADRRRVPRFVYALLWTVFGLALVNSVLFFFQKAAGTALQGFDIGSVRGAVAGTFRSPNSFSQFLEMAVPLAMGLLVARYGDTSQLAGSTLLREKGHRSKHRRGGTTSKTLLTGFGIVIIICALLFSLCRGGFVTLPITMLMLLMFMGVAYRLRDRRTLMLYGGVLGAAFLYVLWLGIGPIIDEALTLFKPQLREFTYGDAIRVIGDFPLLGVGLNNWPHIILQYDSIGSQTWIPRIAYNDTLQIISETGFAGFACAAAFVGVLYLRAIRALRRGGDGERQGIILGGITAMTAALIHAQFDYFFYLPANAVVFAVIAGVVYRLSSDSN
ncbi:MAG: O-antigen ligase family protein [Syntrophales bacterium]|nr:O-antigen ligase family protein [Syntrophales bacterium]MDY0045042.1 O-antigen ligase family protein [Syntrophales bacterium]